METRQRQVVEAFQRVRAFVDEHPATGTLSYASALAMLDDVIEKVRSRASMEYRWPPCRSGPSGPTVWICAEVTSADSVSRSARCGT